MKPTLYFDKASGEPLAYIPESQPIQCRSYAEPDFRPALTDDEKLVMSMIREGFKTSPKIRSVTWFSKDKVQKLLRRLLDKGIIHKTGEKFRGAMVHEVSNA